MRHIFLARFFVCLIIFTAVAANAQTPDSANLLKQLLDLPAPPPVENVPAAEKSVERAPGFYAKNNVPPDDAPIGDLVDYWTRQSRDYRRFYYAAKPSEKTVARLLEFCEQNPEQLSQFLNVFPTKPEVGETVKRLHDALAQKDADSDGVEQIRAWLVYHSNFFVDELVKDAQKVRDQDAYVTNQEELLALAKIDWEKASPILEKLLASGKTQPVSAVLARWAYYSRALAAGDEPDVSKYRRQLQDVVEDRRAPAGARDLAIDALVTEGDWDGRDDWYLSLLGDETLYEIKVGEQTMTGLTTMLLNSPPEKYIQAMVSLVEHKNPTVRRAAIKNLLVHLDDEPPVEVVRAFLPWLTNPNWAPEFPNGRQQLINVLGKVDLPETVPALITILTTEEQYRVNAAEALARYKDSRAVPALKTVLAAENVVYRRVVLIRALDACGGLTDDEKMAALEAYVEAYSTPEAVQNFMSEAYKDYNETTPNPIPLVMNIGNYISGLTDPGDGVVRRAVEREKKLRKTKPAAAASLFQIMQRWRGKVIQAERLRRVGAGEADLETILLTLAQRSEIREKNENDVIPMRTAGGIGRGIAACLLESGAEFESILRSTDADALAAALGCGRLLRVKLPVAEVGAFLKNANKTVALAAERYLESEDSAEARTLILALHPNEALILGARHAFVPEPKNYTLTEPLVHIFQSVSGNSLFGDVYPALAKGEAGLRDEIKSNPDLLAIYGILTSKSAGQLIVRVFKDKIVFTNYEDVARYRERVLTAKEYEDFYRFLVEEKIDTAFPHFAYCEECGQNEFVMLGKNGGRRVFFVNSFDGESPIKRLVEKFASFNEGDLKLHYRLAEQIKGLEVLLADNRYQAQAVWKNGGDFRVLVEDKVREEEIRKNLQAEFEAEEKLAEDDEEEDRSVRRDEQRQKRIEESASAHFSWHSIANGKLGEISTQPLEMPYLYDETQVPKTSGIDPNPRAWKVRAGSYEIRVSDSYGDETGLFKTSRAQPPQIFKKGSYDFPLVTGDSKWVIASKAGNRWSGPRSLVRVNLQTGKEFAVKLPPADIFKPIAFIASQNKVLVYRAKDNNPYNYRREQDEVDEEEAKPAVSTPKDDKNPSPETPEYYLLDAATGATALVKGEFRPLEHATYRPLQPVAAAPDEFWAAIYDKKAKETAVGRYNPKTFTFQTIAKLPQIALDSMKIWVDEKEAKIYFVYEGHLLSAPLL